jgi:hypothetical protein
MKSLLYNNFEKLLYQRYKANSIPFEKFVELQCGNNEKVSVEEVTEGLISVENVRFFIINDRRVINGHCKCIPTGIDGVEHFMPITVKPYILIAVGLSENGIEIIQSFFSSSFESTIPLRLDL